MKLTDFSALIFIRHTETSDLCFPGGSEQGCGGSYYTKQAALILVRWLNVSNYINKKKRKKEKGKKRKGKERKGEERKGKMRRGKRYPFPDQHDFFYGFFNPVSPFAYLQMHLGLIRKSILGQQLFYFFFPMNLFAQPVHSSQSEKAIIAFMSQKLLKCKLLGFYICSVLGIF